MRLTRELALRESLPFRYVVVDEAQDISVPQLRFLAALTGGRPNSLFFAGDLGQRIFQQPFSWRWLGVDVRGRSQSLRINYRTSHQIRTQADRLLDPLFVRYDANGNGMIEKSEVIAAINDYLFGEGDEAISKSDVIKLINLYLFG